MAQFTIVAATPPTAHSSINTEDTYVEILPPANVAVFIKRIRVSFPHTTVSDVPARIRCLRTSAAGATGTSFTPIKRRPSSPVSVCTCLVKNGTAAFTVGTIVDVLLDTTVNTRGVFEWVARDEYDYLWSGVNQRIIVAMRVNLASMVVQVECDYEE